MEVGDLSELARLSDAVALIEASRARCLEDLNALSQEKSDTTSLTVAYVRAKRLLPEERPVPQMRRPQANRAIAGDDRNSATQQRSDTPQPMRQNDQQKGKGNSER